MFANLRIKVRYGCERREGERTKGGYFCCWFRLRGKSHLVVVYHLQTIPAIGKARRTLMRVSLSHRPTQLFCHTSVFEGKARTLLVTV